MWTLKSKTARRRTVQELIQAKKPIGLATQIFLQFVMTDGENDIELETYVSGKDEIEEAILQNLERLNGQEGVIEEVNTPTWKPVRKSEEVEELTPEQIKEQEAAEARQKVEQAYADMEKEIITKEEYSAVVAQLRPVIKKEEVTKR